MSIAADELTKLLALAQLALDEAELEHAREDLARIITMIDAMGEIDTEGVPPLAHPLDAAQRLRADEVSEEVDRTLYQSIAPATANGLYLVPRVIE